MEVREYDDDYANNLYMAWDIIKKIIIPEWQYIFMFKNQNASKWLTSRTKIITNY